MKHNLKHRYPTKRSFLSKFKNVIFTLSTYKDGYVGCQGIPLPNTFVSCLTDFIEGCQDSPG